MLKKESSDESGPTGWRVAIQGEDAHQNPCEKTRILDAEPLHFFGRYSLIASLAYLAKLNLEQRLAAEHGADARARPLLAIAGGRAKARRVLSFVQR